jgi:hypothetical protein
MKPSTVSFAYVAISATSSGSLRFPVRSEASVGDAQSQLWRPPHGRAAALLSDEVFPDVPLRQWVISFPFPLRFLFAAHPQAMGKVLGVVYRAISTHLIYKAGYRLKDGATGAVSLRGPLDPALRICSQPQYTFSHPVSGWRIRLSRQPAPSISARKSAG